MSNSNKIISTEEEVELFLRNLKDVLNNPDFDIERDIDILPKKRHEDPTDPFTTLNTLLDLDYDSHDVFNELLSLEVSHYLETFIDNKDNNLPPFFTFSKQINTKDVYIKVKIRDKKNHKVFCVSFHYVRYPINNKPYC